MTIRKSTDGRAGFSLVETALAMLVAGVGLAAVIALLPTAMDQAKKASDETYAAFFADAVFNSYHAALWDTNVTWAGLPGYETIPPVTLSGGQDVFWKDSVQMTVLMDARVRTQKFIAVSAPGKWGSAGLPPSWQQYDHALRYRLTNRLVSARLRVLELEVWPGEFGQTNNPYRFTTELFNHGF
ncbi:MAG TPA: hypothetical protein PKE12_13835 [Kiritimatiellia bacterium]|nr:hypothetical protein [Kiritimatiellia bacterium]